MKAKLREKIYAGFMFIMIALFSNFWSFSFIPSFLTQDVLWLSIMGLSLLCWLIAFPNINNRKRYRQYSWILIVIFIGLFISMINASVFWNQSFIVTFFSQRNIYLYLFLIALFALEPSIASVRTALRWASYVTLAAWICSIVNPDLLIIPEEVIRSHELTDDIGMYVEGIRFVILYLYFLISDYIESFSVKKFLRAAFWIAFIFLYQNRGLIIGVMIAIIISIVKFRSKHKIIASLFIVTMVTVGIWASVDMWMDLFMETDTQLADKNYNRWLALSFFFKDYLPNFWCYLTGSGFPSIGNSTLGAIMQSGMDKGIYASDLGFIGSWAYFGIITLIPVYYVLIKVIIKDYFPQYLKLLCLHLLVVPLVCTMHHEECIMLIILMFYLYAYYDVRKT